MLSASPPGKQRGDAEHEDHKTNVLPKHACCLGNHPCLHGVACRSQPYPLQCRLTPTHLQKRQDYRKEHGADDEEDTKEDEESHSGVERHRRHEQRGVVYGLARLPCPHRGRDVVPRPLPQLGEVLSVGTCKYNVA